MKQKFSLGKSRLSKWIFGTDDEKTEFVLLCQKVPILLINRSSTYTNYFTTIMVIANMSLYNYERILKLS
jgi:hypothetical protein